jgi:hypothetical protein
MTGSPIWEIVSSDRSDYHMSKPERFGGLSYPQGFFRVKWQGLTFFHGTKTTVPGTDITQNEKRGSASAEAFPNVRTMSTLTNGMQGKGTE